MMTHDVAQTWPLTFADTPRLRFRADSGAVVLRSAGPGEEPRIELSGSRADATKLRLRSDGAWVYADAEMRGDPAQGGAVYTLILPADIHATVRTDFGEISAGGFGPCELVLASDLGAVTVSESRGRLRVKSDVGRVEVTGVAGSVVDAKTEVGAIHLFDVEGQLVLRTETGEIEGRALAGSLDARTEFGTVRLELVRLDPGKHSVRADCGAVDVELPRDADVCLDVEVDGGSAQVDYKSRPKASTVLRLSTGTGSLWVREGPARGFDAVAWPEPQSAPNPQPQADPWPRPEPRPSSPPAARAGEAGREAPPFDYDAELARILMLVAAGELSSRDANELIAALRQR